jgi:hypothetical protein
MQKSCPKCRTPVGGLDVRTNRSLNNASEKVFPRSNRSTNASLPSSRYRPMNTTREWKEAYVGIISSLTLLSLKAMKASPLDILMRPRTKGLIGGIPGVLMEFWIHLCILFC